MINTEINRLIVDNLICELSGSWKVYGFCKYSRLTYTQILEIPYPYVIIHIGNMRELYERHAHNR